MGGMTWALLWQNLARLWHTLAYPGILLNTLAYSGILWHTLSYSGILLHTLAYSGILCILWHTLANSGILWHTQEYSGILWHHNIQSNRVILDYFLQFQWILCHYQVHKGSTKLGKISLHGK